jgi:undecaprenyl diphosphate synthase
MTFRIACILSINSRSRGLSTNRPAGYHRNNRLAKINEQTITQHLMTGNVPDPDLMIRSRELRLSNFLPWQLAYTEFYFTGRLWPEFGPSELHQALLAYQQRQRRFDQLPQSA